MVGSVVSGLSGVGASVRRTHTLGHESGVGYSKFFDWRGAVGSYGPPDRVKGGNFRLSEWNSPTKSNSSTKDKFHNDPCDYYPVGGAFRPNPLGLSNVPKVSARHPVMSVQEYPSRTIVRFRHPSAGYEVKTSVRCETPRKRITEFSDKSRTNLKELAYDLGVLYKPDIFITLTYPGEWESVTTPKFKCTCGSNDGCSDVGLCVCESLGPSGKVVKKHLINFRKRLIRYFNKLNFDISALWFLEFQRRGAPHFHMLIWADGIRSISLPEFQKWLSEKWADVVDHKDPVQRSNHLRAGTNAEWIKKPHFGYAVKYASKMYQKKVPKEFQNVGRFWGLFGCPRPIPLETLTDLTSDDLTAVVDRLRKQLLGYPDWQDKVTACYEAFLRGSRFTLKAYAPLIC